VTDILHTLSELTSAWRERRFEDLARFFDPDIVMKGPDFKELVRGREALVHSYADFMAQSRIADYAESNHSTHAWGDTAVVTYDWTMTYEQKGETKTESGQDMFVFVRRDSHWIAVLRVMLF
jgi:ketosteroid isomerase-like protein